MTPDAARAKALPPGFLGKLARVCVVTRDYRARIEAMLGDRVGP